jgi:hypothetical protein
MTATQPTATEVIRVMRIEKIISLHYKDGFGTEEYSWSRGFFNTSGVALAPRPRGWINEMVDQEACETSGYGT